MLEVTFHPLAEADLFGLYDYIEGRAGAVTAGGYLDRIEALCLSLGTLPGRGVQILRVLYAGRDFGAEDLPK